MSRRTAAIAIAAAEAGVGAVEAMLEAMRFHHAEANATNDKAKKAGHYQLMCEYAAKAAPYTNPRLNAIEHSGQGGGPIQHLHDITPRERMDELAEMMVQARKRPTFTSGGNGHRD